MEEEEEKEEEEEEEEEAEEEEEKEWEWGRVIRFSKILTAKQFFPFFFKYKFSGLFQFLKLKHHCYVKFTSCSTYRTIKATLSV